MEVPNFRQGRWDGHGGFWAADGLPGYYQIALTTYVRRACDGLIRVVSRTWVWLYID